MKSPLASVFIAATVLVSGCVFSVAATPDGPTYASGDPIRTICDVENLSDDARVTIRTEDVDGEWAGTNTCAAARRN